MVASIQEFLTSPIESPCPWVHTSTTLPRTTQKPNIKSTLRNESERIIEICTNTHLHTRFQPLNSKLKKFAKPCGMKQPESQHLKPGHPLPCVVHFGMHLLEPSHPQHVPIARCLQWGLHTLSQERKKAISLKCQTYTGTRSGLHSPFERMRKGTWARSPAREGLLQWYLCRLGLVKNLLKPKFLRDTKHPSYNKLIPG